MNQLTKFTSSSRSQRHPPMENLSNNHKDFPNQHENSHELTSKKTLELHNLVIVVRTVFPEDNKYYPHVSVDECFYKL